MGILTNLGFDLRPQLAATGLLASLGAFYALYRWGGTFTVAGFLFNGGIAGYAFLQTHQFLDYQGTPHVSWKSIPLTMFVTQRGLLYAIPAGLLLLWQWRAKYGSDSEREKATAASMGGIYPLRDHAPVSCPHLYCLKYCASGSVFDPACCQIVAPQTRRRCRSPSRDLHLAYHRSRCAPGQFSQWHFGWTQNVGELKMPFFRFWFFNFGVFLPLAIALVWIVARQESIDLSVGNLLRRN